MNSLKSVVRLKIAEIHVCVCVCMTLNKVSSIKTNAAYDVREYICIHCCWCSTTKNVASCVIFCVDSSNTKISIVYALNSNNNNQMNERTSKRRKKWFKLYFVEFETII